MRKTRVLIAVGLALLVGLVLFYRYKAPEPAPEETGVDLAEEPYVRFQGPETFSYPELEVLLNDRLSPELENKLDTLLTTPFISNEAYYRGARPHRPIVEPLWPSLRVVMWNIERGLRLEDIQLMFTNPGGFDQRVRREGQDVNRRTLEDELAVLRSADVLVLNEVDWGLKRSQYRHVTKELAETLDMNWAFGVEFVEVDPINLGTEDFRGIEDAQERRKWVAEIQVDRSRLLALHGTTVLSRYPIVEVRLVPFELQGYDWFQEEKQRISNLEKGKSEVSGGGLPGDAGERNPPGRPHVATGDFGRTRDTGRRDHDSCHASREPYETEEPQDPGGGAAREAARGRPPHHSRRRFEHYFERSTADKPKA